MPRKETEHLRLRCGHGSVRIQATYTPKGESVIEATERQEIIDEEHLRLLPIAYWVLGASWAFFSLYGLLYVGMGALFALSPESMGPGEPPPPFLGWFFGGIGLFFMLFFGGIALLHVLAGFWIRDRRRRTGALLAAAAACLFVPFGTLVGVVSFIVLLRPSVKARFDAADGARAPVSPGEPPAPPSIA